MDEVKKFYKKVTNREEFEQNLADAKDAIRRSGLDERASMYFKSHGWSGDLMESNQSYFLFIREISRYFGDSGGPGPVRA